MLSVLFLMPTQPLCSFGDHFWHSSRKLSQPRLHHSKDYACEGYCNQFFPPLFFLHLIELRVPYTYIITGGKKKARIKLWDILAKST